MTSPTTYDPLVTDFQGVEDNRFEGKLPEGQAFEHYQFEFDNGYAVSVARTNVEGQASVGYENGNWEALIVRKDPMASYLGLIGLPAPELKHLTTHEPQPGIRVAGDLTSEAVNGLLHTVSELPTPEDTTPITVGDVLDALDVAPVETEEEVAANE